MDIVTRTAELMEKENVFCLATIVASSQPEVQPGRKAIVLEDGTLEGSLGTETLDTKLSGPALEAIKSKKRKLVEIDNGIQVFIDILSSGAHLVICGAGHIAVPLAQIARGVGFRVTVLDDRSDFANPSRFPDCEVIAEDFALALREMSFGPTTYVVVITRGHVHDVDCLTEVLGKKLAYVGMIGSRRRVRIVLEILDKQGFDQEHLKKVFTPIGLPIGAESPEEIAISIVSELVCVRRKGPEQAITLRTSIG
ncbi:MAG: XdhC/CoxI family protein [Desulfobacterales bacterium]|jgi:xanthine dehydrogenase accessory factor